MQTSDSLTNLQSSFSWQRRGEEPGKPQLFIAGKPETAGAQLQSQQGHREGKVTIPQVQPSFSSRCILPLKQIALQILINLTLQHPS